MNGPCEVHAHAKLTLRLKVIGRRPDGYHLLDAEMVTVDLADTLAFAAGDSLDVVVEAGAARGQAVPAGDHNLVRRALAMVGERAAVRLVKRIPAGAGLGGGSADAAAVLRWAGWSDMGQAARLGADVPFCLAGGRARVGGIGEVVEPLDISNVEGSAYTLLTPPFGVSTASVYAAWDMLGGPSGDGVNDLEAAALVVEPRLARWRDRLGESTGEHPALAGSGSTWFVAGDHPGAGRLVVRVVGPSRRC